MISSIPFSTLKSLVLSFGLCLSASALAEPSFDKAKVISTVSAELKGSYVFPEVAEKMSAALKTKLNEGRYKDINNPDAFAKALREDLADVSHDKHIDIFYMEKAPVEQVDSAEGRAAAKESMKAHNFGFKKLEILPGNIGYIELRSFDPAEFGGPTAIASMNYTANTKALIFDLRNNGGGDPSMIQLLSSYLFERSTHLNSFYLRKTDSYEQFWTAAHVEGPRYLNREVYVLTNAGTFSAAEEFTYNLKTLKRATIVGETTGGGAHPVDFHYFKDIKFGAMIPIGRAVNPITKTNWEGTGVEPDVKVNSDKALNSAHSLALEQLIRTNRDPVEAKRLSWSLESIKALSNPLNLDPASIQAYAGAYGDRSIALENNQLIYSRGSRKSKLVALAPDRFAIEGLDSVRLQFHRDQQGRLSSVSSIYLDGKVDKSERKL